mmetsp:Transcript_24801/g.35570  ORF Transcript_24801/g.35570 Transcript_24801/m.35570 type:complete len:271 (+) Transcript_24801:40-852(+)
MMPVFSIFILISFVFASLLCIPSDAFYSSGRVRFGEVPLSFTGSSVVLRSTATTADSVCSTPTNVPDPDISASVLRSIEVTDMDGSRINLGDAIGRNAIVVFLRHLACPYCWSYAKEWSDLQSEMKNSNISGPFFISIGDQEKLQKFLELNPFMEREKVFVDDFTDFKAYKAVGFGRFDQTDKEVAKQVKLSAPTIGGIKSWWKYFTNLNVLSPIPQGLTFGQIPEGVLRLGGTFVVSGDDIIYRWSDRLPGDHPDVKQVLKIAQEKSMT